MPESLREQRGRRVREVWVRWAAEQPDPKDSWLTPWEDLDEGQREVDMRIGEALAADERERIRHAAHGFYGPGFAGKVAEMLSHLDRPAEPATVAEEKLARGRAYALRPGTVEIARDRLLEILDGEQSWPAPGGASCT